MNGKKLFYPYFSESWVHYNDAHINLISLKDVLSSQAYILFYERVDKLNQNVDDDVTFNFKRSKKSVPKLKKVNSTKW